MAKSEKDQALQESRVMRDAAMVVLLDRLGGSASYTEADYQAIVARYGGQRLMAIHVEVVRPAGEPSRVELHLVSKAPANTELVS